MKIITLLLLSPCKFWIVHCQLAGIDPAMIEAIQQSLVQGIAEQMRLVLQEMRYQPRSGDPDWDNDQILGKINHLSLVLTQKLLHPPNPPNVPNPSNPSSPSTPSNPSNALNVQKSSPTVITDNGITNPLPTIPNLTNSITTDPSGQMQKFQQNMDHFRADMEAFGDDMKRLGEELQEKQKARWNS